MNLLQPYVGRYVTATSASTKIDVDAILAGCDAVDSEASQINTVNSEISDIGSRITAKALSVDGKTVLNTVNECCTGINGVQSMITGMTASIREAAVSVYNQFQEQFNEEARICDEEAAGNSQN